MRWQNAAPKIAAGVALALLWRPLGAWAEERVAVGVFPIRAQGVKGFDAATLDKFTSFLDAVVISAGYATVPRGELSAAIAEQQAESYKGCYDERCQIELGKAIAAEKAVISEWARFGDSCVLTVKLYDIRRALTERSATADGKCTESGLRGAIETVGNSLRLPVAAAEPVSPVYAEPEKPAPAPEKIAQEDNNTGLIVLGVVVGVLAVAGIAVGIALATSADSTGSEFDPGGGLDSGGGFALRSIRF